jgi:polysaccharide pyruvyl transferase WcaK-like protein
MNREFEITILGTSPGRHSILVQNHKIVFKGMKPLTSLKTFCFKFSNPKMFFNYFKIDKILDIGAGDSYSDIYGKERFLSLDFSKKFYGLLGKKQLLLPQTIGPFNNNKVRRSAIKSINRCHTVLTRDKQSFDYAKNITSQKNLHEAIDVAFFMPYQQEEIDSQYINVGIGVSALLWHGGYTGQNQFKLKMAYPDLIRSTIEYFKNFKTVKIHLVSHVVSNNYNVENDYAVSRSLVKEYNHAKLLLAPFFRTPIEAKNYISGLDFFTGSRMHACIAAFSSKVPVFPMAYSRKFNGLFADTLLYPYMGDMINENSGQILENLANAFEKREILKETITERMNTTVAERYQVLINQLKRFVGD